MLFGVILVVIGILLLLEKMGIITGNFWDYLWPVVIIVIGLSFVTKKHGGNGCWSLGGSKKHDKHHKVVDEQ